MQQYIVTRTHTQDYISSDVYLTYAASANEAIITCMEYNEIDVEYTSDEAEYDKRYKAELARLHSLSLRDLEQDQRENGTVWHADTFTLPTTRNVVHIASLNTD